MIAVTITFRANKETMRRCNLLGAHVWLADQRQFYVPSQIVADLFQLCKQRGWEMLVDPVFTTSFEQILDEITKNEWKEDAA